MYCLFLSVCILYFILDSSYIYIWICKTITWNVHDYNRRTRILRLDCQRFQRLVAFTCGYVTSNLTSQRYRPSDPDPDLGHVPTADRSTLTLLIVTTWKKRNRERKICSLMMENVFLIMTFNMFSKR